MEEKNNIHKNHFHIGNHGLEFCTGTCRQMKDGFFRRAEPGPQMKFNFSNGPGRAGTLEVIFRTGQQKNKWVF